LQNIWPSIRVSRYRPSIFNRNRQSCRVVPAVFTSFIKYWIRKCPFLVLHKRHFLLNKHWNSQKWLRHFLYFRSKNLIKLNWMNTDIPFSNCIWCIIMTNRLLVFAIVQVELCLIRVISSGHQLAIARLIKRPAGRPMPPSRVSVDISNADTDRRPYNIHVWPRKKAL